MKLNMIDDLDEDVIFIKNAMSKIPDHRRDTRNIFKYK